MAGARAATGDGDGMIGLVVPGRPTGSSASGHPRKTQDKDGRADDQAPRPLPGMFVCPFAESLGCVGCYFGLCCCCVVAVAPPTVRPLARDPRVLIGWSLALGRPSTVRSDEWPAWFSFWFSGCWRALAKGTAWAFFYCVILLLLLLLLLLRHWLWVLVWAGACYWHGVGGFMFNSS